MTTIWGALASALWLGILTSISPCPLASNIAAVSYVGKGLENPRRVLLAGLAYTLGRALTYVIVAMVVVAGLLSIPSVSFFLQRHMNQVLGPLLILVGVVLMGWIPIRLAAPGWSEKLQRRMGDAGVLGAGALGMLFALSFCPVSAGLFFGGLIPLAVGARSRVVLPAVYGVGTGLPVVVFAVLLALGAQWVGRAFHVLTRLEKAARPATGIIFILAGLYLSATNLLGMNF